MGEETYTGLCIGGPSDGHLAESRAPFLKIAEPLEHGPTFCGRGEPTAMLVAHDFCYAHVEFKSQTATFGFWVPDNTPLETRGAHVLGALVSAYEKLAQ